MRGSRWLICAFGVAVATFACGERAERNRDATHVVLISIDCLNQRQLATGIREGYTPALATLAEGSIAFSRAYAHAPWTTPSHMSMFTGLLPRQHGHTTPYREMIAAADTSKIEGRYPSLASMLADRGYETVAFVGKGPISARYGLGNGFQRYHESSKNRDQSDFGETLGELRDWLDEGGDAPFFLFLHTFDLHTPRPPTRQRDRDSVSYLDRRIAEVVAELQERGLYENSLVIVTGDHGSEMIHTDGKCCIHGAGHYEENLKVPLLVKLPGARLSGARTTIARHVDLLPTIADVLGIEIADYRGPGVSLLDESAVGSRYSFSEADARCIERYALVSERYKYIFTPQGAAATARLADPQFSDKYCVEVCRVLPPREEFYDLLADPFEERDLLRGADVSEHAAELGRMRTALSLFMRFPPQFERSARDPTTATVPDEELQESLRQLGYAE